MPRLTLVEIGKFEKKNIELKKQIATLKKDNKELKEVGEVRMEMVREITKTCIQINETYL